jgi:hypothetical protein
MNFIITHSGDDFLRQIITGSIPRINTVGIVLGGNDKFDDELDATLRRGNYAFIQYCSARNNPFIIFNIDKDTLLDLCRMHKMNFIISATVTPNKWIDFILMESDGTEIAHKMAMLTGSGLIKLKVNMNDFTIPIFDFQGHLDVSRTNLDNPNRISYTMNEINRLNMPVELSADLRRIIKMNRCDESDTTGHAQCLRRGIFLKVLHGLHAIFAQQN